MEEIQNEINQEEIIVDSPQKRIDPYSLNMRQIINIVATMDQLMKDGIINYNINDTKVEFICDEVVKKISSQCNKLKFRNNKLKETLKINNLYYDSSRLDDLKEWLEETIDGRNEDEVLIPLKAIKEQIFLLETENLLLGME